MGDIHFSTRQVQILGLCALVSVLITGVHLFCYPGSGLLGYPPHAVSLTSGADDPQPGEGEDIAVRREGGVYIVGEGRVWVHLAGAVKNPGVYRVPKESRLADLVGWAGGLTDGADLEGCNLAAVLRDGQKIVIPGGDESSSLQDEPMQIGLNSADVEDLQMLPGIGPVIARRIIEYREEVGGFSGVRELLEVRGIGEKKLEDIEPLVYVSR